MRLNPQAYSEENEGVELPAPLQHLDLRLTTRRTRSPLKTAIGILAGCVVAGVGAWLWGEIARSVAARAEVPAEASPAMAAVIRYAEAVSNGEADAFGVEQGVQSKGEFDRFAAGLSARHRRGKVREEFEKGQELMATGRHADAVPHLAEAVKLDPQFAEAHYRLGLAYVHTGDMRKAEQELKALAMLDADLARLLENLVRQ